MTSAWLSGYARRHKTRRISNEPESSARCAQLAHKTALMVMSDQTSAQVYINNGLLMNSFHIIIIFFFFTTVQAQIKEIKKVSDSKKG